MTKNFDHLFFRIDSYDVAPIALKRHQTYIEICFPISTQVYPILYTETPTIKFQKIPGPQTQIDWSLENNC